MISISSEDSSTSSSSTTSQSSTESTSASSSSATSSASSTSSSATSSSSESASDSSSESTSEGNGPAQDEGGAADVSGGDAPTSSSSTTSKSSSDSEEDASEQGAQRLKIGTRVAYRFKVGNTGTKVYEGRVTRVRDDNTEMVKKEPATWNEMMESKDKDKWLEAVNAEVNSRTAKLRNTRQDSSPRGSCRGRESTSTRPSHQSSELRH